MDIAVVVRNALALGGLLAGWVIPGMAQGVRGHFMAQGIPSLAHADPVPGGGELSEFRVLQPVAMGDLGVGNGFRARLTLNLENWTLPDGELAPGNWGEGFMDRRHPHTVVHEAMAWGVIEGARVRGSLAGGKGFVPFGTDDPMSRPFVRYPVNHHLAQILERAVLAAGGRSGPVAVEASLFNGDEPESPTQWPNWSRFGDSWAFRLTVFPLAGLEVQGSYADVASPEHRGGAGLPQRKWSAAARLDRLVGAVGVYGMVEWARTDEGDAFSFASVLGEGAARLGRHRVGYRFERTSRPEEERIYDDLFRSIRPHLDDNIVGITRWTLHTVHYEARFEPAGVGVTPYLEATLGSVADLVDGVFSVQAFYGSDAVRSLLAGVRLDLGGRMGRMGRYGVVAPPPEWAAGDGHRH